MTDRLPALRPHLRWMIRRDMPEAMAIEQASFSPPWDEEHVLTLLRERPIIGMVAEVYEAVAGTMIYELRKRGLFLHRFAVHPDYRRRGVGSAMAAKVISKLTAHRRERLELIVPESNTAAHLFWRARGFLAVDVERDGCETVGGTEDGYRFAYQIDVAAMAQTHWNGYDPL